MSTYRVRVGHRITDSNLIAPLDTLEMARYWAQRQAKGPSGGQRPAVAEILDASGNLVESWDGFSRDRSGVPVRLGPEQGTESERRRRRLVEA